MESSSLSEKDRVFFATLLSSFNDKRITPRMPAERIEVWDRKLSSDMFEEHYLLILGLTFLFFFAIFRYSRIIGMYLKKENSKEQRKQVDPARVERKKIFLQHAENYGYSGSPAGFIDHWRPKEFPCLISPMSYNREESNQMPIADEKEVYLDYAGSALPTRSQLERIYRNQTILANPHSSGPAASRTSLLIEQTKKKILDHFHANPGRFAFMKHSKATSEDLHPGYEIVFTSGATEALRIVSERFPWMHCSECGRKSLLVYPQNAHTSVVGMRGPVLEKGADFLCKPLNKLLEDVHANNICNWRKGQSSSSCDCEECVDNLLVLPVECNFGGDRPDTSSALRQVNAYSTPDCRWWTMIDIAKAAATGPVNLKELNPDFACVSFYKIFGEPTGLGCLFVKRTAVDVLMGNIENKETIHSYFGGGSVDAILPQIDFAVARSEPTALASLNNGTVHFRGIVSLLQGFEELERLGGMNAIRRHSATLAKELVNRLTVLRHENGRPAAVIYGAWGKPFYDVFLPGPTVTFNVLRKDGTYVGYNEVMKLASLNRPPLQMRSGCFCNPGACQLALELSDHDIINNYRTSGHVCGDQIDVINGRPTGAIRASFGKDSLWEDVDALATFIERLFVTRVEVDGGPTSDSRWDGGPRRVVLSELYIFPIKSCAAQRVKRWKFDRKSGKPVFDREFALVDSCGTAMRLQAYPKMAFLRPSIDIQRRTMTITAPGQRMLELGLDEESKYTFGESIVRVCGNRCGGKLWGDFEASEWFSKFLGVRCWLARYSAGHYRLPEFSRIQITSLRSPQIAFANEQPVLLISEHAVDELNDVLESQNQKRVSSRHFRPNMVVRLAGRANKSWSHAEDGWRNLEVIEKDVKFFVVGQCARCSMIDVDPTTGMKGKTLRALADYRKRNGQVTFGIFLKGSSEESGTASENVWLEEGDILFCE